MKFPLHICPTVLPLITGLHTAIVAKIKDMAALSIFHDWSYYVLPPVKGNNLTLEVALTIWLDLYHVLKEEEAQFRKDNRGKGHKRGRTD